MTTIARLPVQAQVLEAALHSVCDQGRWQDTVHVVLDKNTNEYLLELVDATMIRSYEVNLTKKGGQ